MPDTKGILMVDRKDGRTQYTDGTLSPQPTYFQNEYGGGSIVPTITSESLAPSEKLNIPNLPPPRDMRPAIDTSLESLLASFNAPTAQETTGDDLSSRILSSMDKLGGEKARLQELEGQAGLPEQRKQLQDIINQMQGLQKEAQAVPLKIEEAYSGVGGTVGGAAPIQAGEVRKLAIKQLGLAAVGQTIQGNISLAQTQVQQALDAEFEPIKNELEILKQAYTMNKDTLERIDKKKADTLNLVLNERTRLLGLQEADRKEIYDMAMLAAKFGAPQGAVQDILLSKTREEALQWTGGYLEDPAAKQQLENAKLTNLLTKSQINKSNYELGLLQKYGGMTPAQYADYVKAERKEIEAEKDAAKKATLEGIALQEKIGTLNGILSSSALSSAVGTSYLTRAPKGILGNIGAFIGFGAGSVLEAGVQKMTGEYQNFIGNVEQLVSKEFIENLIAVKAQGATFGALTDREGEALRQAATKIESWRVEDKNGNVTHYNIGEEQFKREIETILGYTKTAYQRATGSAWLPDEQEFWDELNASQSLSNFSPEY